MTRVRHGTDSNTYMWVQLSDTAVQEMQAEEDRRQRSVDSQRARAQAGLAALEGESAAASAAGAGASEAVLRDVRVRPHAKQKGGSA